MYSWNYGLRKTLLDKCLKALVSDDPSTTGYKHCWNLDGSTFIILIDHCEKNELEKVSLSDM